MSSVTAANKNSGRFMKYANGFSAEDLNKLQNLKSIYDSNLHHSTKHLQNLVGIDEEYQY